jgi:hypothetical protein
MHVAEITMKSLAEIETEEQRKRDEYTRKLEQYKKDLAEHERKCVAETEAYERELKRHEEDNAKYERECAAADEKYKRELKQYEDALVDLEREWAEQVARDFFEQKIMPRVWTHWRNMVHARNVKRYEEEKANHERICIAMAEAHARQAKQHRDEVTEMERKFAAEVDSHQSAMKRHDEVVDQYRREDTAFPAALAGHQRRVEFHEWEVLVRSEVQKRRPRHILKQRVAFDDAQRAYHDEVRARILLEKGRQGLLASPNRTCEWDRYMQALESNVERASAARLEAYEAQSRAARAGRADSERTSLELQRARGAWGLNVI